MGNINGFLQWMSNMDSLIDRCEGYASELISEKRQIRERLTQIAQSIGQAQARKQQIMQEINSIVQQFNSEDTSQSEQLSLYSQITSLQAERSAVDGEISRLQAERQSLMAKQEKNRSNCTYITQYCSRCITSIEKKIQDCERVIARIERAENPLQGVSTTRFGTSAWQVSSEAGSRSSEYRMAVRECQKRQRRLRNVSDSVDDGEERERVR